MEITLAHGSGGAATGELIRTVFAKAFDNPILRQMDDSAVVPGSGQLAVTTDSFVVQPLFFPGGDIGRLAVCGTVNDLLMRGATPKYLTAGFILETGCTTEDLSRIARSMAATAAEAGVTIVAGDTKVVEGSGNIYINTAGVGFLPTGTHIAATALQPGDALLVSGAMGDHHAAILSARMGMDNTVRSDCAPLGNMVAALLQGGVEVHTLRDITRGGLGTVLCELAEAANCGIEIDEAAIPVHKDVRAFAHILGLELLHMGNEGKLLAAVPAHQVDQALELLRASRYGAEAAVIGTVTDGEGVVALTPIGGKRRVSVLYGEGLPRIC